jgi:phosphoserine aminotransferase
MARLINFGPGPAMLPLPALEQAQRDLVELGSTGISIVEHSHRGKDYEAIHAECKALLRELFGIPASHHVLFMQGGARGQFAFVPMNLLKPGESADYITTGVWSEGAFSEAKILGTAREAANTKEADGKFRRVPKESELELDPNAAYVHLTSNNTIFGTQFFDFPSTKAPLVVDMSSDIGWRPIDVSKFGLIYAGAQKNLGVPGATVLFIHDDLVKRSRKDIPEIFRYSVVAKEDSLMNTAPTFAIYMVRNVARWIKDLGGLPAMEARNKKKADTLYGAIDEMKDFYEAPVEKDSRSVMNVVFRLPTEALEEELVKVAKENGMVGIKGHRSVGGIRVSLYNAVEPTHVEKLVSVMRDFAQKKG